MPLPARLPERIPTVVLDSHEALSRTIARRIAEVIAGRRAAGAQPEDLEIGRADLEDVFLEIMHGEPIQVPA